jgi:hypothetical protein
MKKLFTLSATILICQISFSQQFTDPSNQWNVKSSGWFYYNTEIFRYSGDTMIMNTFYNKMYVAEDSSAGAIWRYAGAIREWEGRVYGYLPYSYDEGLFYDFNLEPGGSVDIISLWCSWPITVTCSETGSIEINGQLRKTITFDEPYSEQWIEGIGSQYGPLYSNIYNCVTDIYYNLLCYYNNGNQLYMNPDATSCYETNVGINNIPAVKSIKVFPNPSTGIFYLDFDNSGMHLPASIEIHNSIGKQVYHDPDCIDFRKPIDLSAHPDGVYSIRVYNDRSTFFGKLIISH